ncbi:MAG: hypothetical protein IPP82_16895 [Xanthomonadales bacterium]|nr:hypothetical protein [Xanthomonadales bacterium]
MSAQCPVPLAVLFAALLLSMSAQAVPVLDYEVEPVLGATSFVRPALLSGPGYQVDPHVEIRGYMARFTIDTAIGPIHAESVEILGERIAELPALEALEGLTRSQAFVDAADASVTKTAQGLGQILRHPVRTLSGIPAGVARYFGNRLKRIGNQAQALSDRGAREFGANGNPYPRADGPMTEARDIDRAEASADSANGNDSWYADVGDEAGREIKRQLKYGQVRRELAERLGIDPYTSNPYLRERLDKFAWAGASGHFAAATALGTIGGVGGIGLAYGSQLNDLVWKLDPEQLRERNAKRLGRYCRDELLTRQFLRRGTFTPTLQTALLDALERLQPEVGGDALLELAITAQSELEARYIVNALGLVADRLGPRAHGGHLLTVGAGLAYDSVDGERVLPLPIDYLAWTGEVARFLDSEEFRNKHKTVLVSGSATPRSQQELTSRGWNIVVDAHRRQQDGLVSNDESIADRR